MLLYLEKTHLDMTCASIDGCVIGAVQHSSVLCVEISHIIKSSHVIHHFFVVCFDLIEYIC